MEMRGALRKKAKETAKRIVKEAEKRKEEEEKRENDLTGDRTEKEIKKEIKERREKKKKEIKYQDTEESEREREKRENPGITLDLKVKSWMNPKNLLKGKLPMTDDIREPICLLIRNGGDIEVFDDVPGGIMKIEGTEGTEKAIYLDANKMVRIPLKDGDIKGWIAEENNALCYPQDPLFSSDMMNKLFRAIITDYKEFDKEFSGKLNLSPEKLFGYLLVVIIAIVLIGSNMGMIRAMFGG